MPVKIFFCYAHEDEPLLNKLKTYLSPLQRWGLIEPWHDRNISAGTEWEPEIYKQLNTSQIILLLVSPDFMASDYCYSIEMQQAIEQHKRGEARVIPNYSSSYLLAKSTIRQVTGSAYGWKAGEKLA